MKDTTKESKIIQRYYYPFRNLDSGYRGARVFLPGLLESDRSKRIHAVYEYDADLHKVYLACLRCRSILNQEIKPEEIKALPYTFPKCMTCHECSEHWYVRLVNEVTETIEAWKNPLENLHIGRLGLYESFKSFDAAKKEKAIANVYGDYGGEFYFSCVLEHIQCSEKHLIELAQYVDTQNIKNPDGVMIYYEITDHTHTYCYFSTKLGLNYYYYQHHKIYKSSRINDTLRYMIDEVIGEGKIENLQYK